MDLMIAVRRFPLRWLTTIATPGDASRTGAPANAAVESAIVRRKLKIGSVTALLRCNRWASIAGYPARFVKESVVAMTASRLASLVAPLAAFAAAAVVAHALVDGR